MSRTRRIDVDDAWRSKVMRDPRWQAVAWRLSMWRLEYEKKRNARRLSVAIGIVAGATLWTLLFLTGCVESNRLPSQAELDRYVPIACEQHPNQEACRSMNDRLIVEKSK